jgi:hypothetical protein
VIPICFIHSSTDYEVSPLPQNYETCSADNHKSFMDDIGMPSYIENNNGHDHNGPEYNPEVPQMIDSERSPQLDKVICRCRCGCACSSSRGGAEIESDGGGCAVQGAPGFDSAASDTASDDGRSVNGDEGAHAEHEVEVGDLGMVKIKTIMTALARHRRCTCHPRGPGMPYADDDACFGIDSMTSLGFFPTDSMIAEHGSDLSRVTSMGSMSVHSGSTRSMDSSGFMPCVGEHLEMPAYHFTATPILLTQEISFPLNVNAGLHYMRYPMDLSMSDSASTVHSEYDMW